MEYLWVTVSSKEEINKLQKETTSLKQAIGALEKDKTTVSLSKFVLFTVNSQFFRMIFGWIVPD